MKKILHLFRIEKFTESFIELMRDNTLFEHTFWVYGNEYLYDLYGMNYLKRANVKFLPRLDIKMNKKSTEKQLQSYDLIVYHGVFDNIIINYFYNHRNLLEKLALYFWGGDKVLLGNRKDKLCKKYVIRKAAVIITIIPQDYLDIKKKYHPIGKHFCAGYFDSSALEFMEIVQNLPRENNEIVNIQIVNSATETNDHINMLNILSKFKNENIKIYLPLSYGDVEYANKVIKYGENIFGDKLVPIREFMPLKEYCLFINKIDIAIFNMIRQQALGNIYLLLQSGCKLFFNSQGLLWDFFKQDVKCSVARTEEINEMTFMQFVDFSEENKQMNRLQVLKSFSKNNSIKQWENIFQFRR